MALAGHIQLSLWLPVGREAFYSTRTDRRLLKRVDGALTGECVGDRHNHKPKYIPHLRESVLRRLAEVLPYSFGYNRVATCEFCQEPDERERPVAITLVLDLHARDPHGRPRPAKLAHANEINDRLREAGVERVLLRLDENGFYTFDATLAGPRTPKAEGVLREHIVAVFGGGFEVDRLSRERRPNEGVNAVRRYNGLVPVQSRQEIPDTYEGELGEPAPTGALNFHQLNIMTEALCNASLLPAVFFEHYEPSRRFLEEAKGRVAMIVDLATFLETLVTPVDARTMEGRTETLRRFMVTSRGSLGWLSRSVESVRRSLLDKMMAVSHRRARLIQLDLAGIAYERTPELTGEASDSQLRGYVVLVATKLPLLVNVSECAQQAVRFLERQVDAALSDSFGSHDITSEAARVQDLGRLTNQWTVMLAGLRDSVSNLGAAVEQDWQERLLYEQEQARSEQQALAEIERSRRGTTARIRGDRTYNAVMLIFTALAVVIAVPTLSNAELGDGPFLDKVLGLWQLMLLIVPLLLAPLAAGIVTRHWRRRKPDSDAYLYEFAVRLNVPVRPDHIHDLLTRPSKKIQLENFGRAVLRPLGGWRTDKIASDTELVKVHSTAAVRLRRYGFAYARFEIVIEVIIREISGEPEYFIRHCRVFGDSPKPIELERLKPLVVGLVDATCRSMTGDVSPGTSGDSGHNDVSDLDNLMRLVGPIYDGPVPTAVIPRQRSGDDRDRGERELSSPVS